MLSDMVDNNWSLPVTFYFQVKIDGEEYAFKEVSGLNTEMVFETICEGDSNDSGSKVPKQIKHGNLVLKRALGSLNSVLITWVKNVLEGELSLPVITKDIQISLLDGEGTPIYNWNCLRAYPVKWSIEDLDAQKNSVLIETLEFAYATLKRS